MNAIRLHAQSFMPFRTHYASVISDPEQLAVMHDHDYYEIFAVRQGTAQHCINGALQTISPRMLYLIRPADVHCYLNPSPEFQIVNMMVPRDTLQGLLGYLGSEAYAGQLLSTPLPPHTTLSASGFGSLMRQLHDLKFYGTTGDDTSEAIFRQTVFQILTAHFPIVPAEEQVSMPDWLRELSIEMARKGNFTEGLPALYRLSGRSMEHTSRACRKYLGKTPSQLVNEARLEFAARELVQFDADIIDVCNEAGFESLSHFYHLFRSHFGMTPKQFRQSARELSSQDLAAPPGQKPLAEAIPLREVIGLQE